MRIPRVLLPSVLVLAFALPADATDYQLRSFNGGTARDNRNSNGNMTIHYPQNMGDIIDTEDGQLPGRGNWVKIPKPIRRPVKTPQPGPHADSWICRLFECPYASHGHPPSFTPVDSFGPMLGGLPPGLGLSVLPPRAMPSRGASLYHSFDAYIPRRSIRVLKHTRPRVVGIEIGGWDHHR